MYKRFILRGSDYKNLQKIASVHDNIYSSLDILFQGIDISDEDKVDTKFFIDEIADNFLLHDSIFTKATIDIWINRTRDVEIHITHNGVDFNPLAIDSRCSNILAAATRLTVGPPRQRDHQHLDRSFDLSFNLK